MRPEIPELVDIVSHTYDTIPASQRGRTVILTDNYGEAGAINLCGPARGLPTAVSRALELLVLAPARRRPADDARGLDARYMAPYFADCRHVTALTNRYGVRKGEWKKPVLICHQPRRPPSQVWGPRPGNRPRHPA
jgi:hypothetical protein